FSREARNRLLQSSGVEGFDRLGRYQFWRNLQVRTYADDKQPRARLRHEEICVDHQGPEPIAGVRISLAHRLEVSAAMGGQSAANILDGDHGWRAAFGGQSADDVPKGVEGAR